MTTVRNLHISDARTVVDRIVRRLNDDARRQPLVNPHLDEELLYDTILQATSATWVAQDERGVVGHLYAAVLADPVTSFNAWTGPDGASYDDEIILHQLVALASESWRRAGATHHYSWSLGDPDRTDPWRALGYDARSVRGVMRIVKRDVRRLPTGAVLRLAERNDVERALELDHVIDLAQGEPKATTRKDLRTTRRELLALLEDPEVRHYVVEADGRVLAQAITFPLPARRGSFDETLHLSEVVVDPSEQGQGIASAMIDEVLEQARRHGFRYVEAQWRVTNEQASSFWPRYGLTPTYVRLGRTLD